MVDALNISWCGDQHRTMELAEFFKENVDGSYISHSELQGARALSPTQWREDLTDRLVAEIAPRLAEASVGVPGLTSRPILVAEINGELAGLSFVTFEGGAPVPYSILEDFIVRPSLRRAGVGTKIVDWIDREARERNIHRMFLESGVHNHRAHQLFERLGFEICSHVMMRTL